MGKTGDPREQVSNASIRRVKEQSVPGERTAEISSELIQLRGCPRLTGRIQKKSIRIESRVLNEFVVKSMELIPSLLDYHHYGRDIPVLGALVSAIDLEFLKRIGRGEVGKGKVRGAGCPCRPAVRGIHNTDAIQREVRPAPIRTSGN